MVLTLFNTATHQKEIFAPLTPPLVRLYSCGPTVYNYAHIGNWRTFILSDLLRRTLEYQDYQVRQVVNITDVDDKTIAGSQAAGLPLTEFTKKYEQIFLADLTAFNILPPTVLPHATDYLPQMIKLVERLLAAGRAYPTSDGVYFKIASFPAYGRLSGRQGVAKTATDDFALWKFHTPADGAVAWPAPFGRGRPGWHLECSAMVLETLGPTIDIHTGGSDLIFPHHENEIAQSESVTGQPLARTWVHGAFLLVDGQKMSKSLGNIYTSQDLRAKNISPLAYRYWLLMGHYRSTLNFTWAAVNAAQTRWERLKKHLATLPDGGQVRPDLREAFLAAINDDLNFPRALALIPAELKAKGKTNLDPAAEKATWREFDRVFGLDLFSTA